MCYREGLLADFFKTRIHEFSAVLARINSLRPFYSCRINTDLFEFELIVKVLKVGSPDN